MAAPLPDESKDADRVLLDTYHLSKELVPGHECGVQGVCVLSDGSIVSGDDSAVVRIWKKVDGQVFADPFEVIGHTKHIRRILAIGEDVPDGVPAGGFVTACLDGAIRVFDAKGTLVRMMKDAHERGVIDLHWGQKPGYLVSGGWDGSAAVWNLANGDLVERLLGMANATCAIQLPNGDIITGCTGRKVDDKHVDFAIHVFRDGAQIKTINDHEGPVRALCVIPGVGFASGSNDGSIVVRTEDGAPLYKLLTAPFSKEGKLATVFRLEFSKGELLAMCEDHTLRVFKGDSLAQEIRLSGVVFGADRLPSGDIVCCGEQSHTSRRGHVYIWSRDAEHTADEATMKAFKQDVEDPPEAKKGPGGGGGGDQIKIRGKYEDRSSLPGAKEGEFGFFAHPSGQTMICSWTPSGWTDIGFYAGEAGAGGSRFDVDQKVTLDTDTGTKTMPLQFNLSDDPVKVAKDFIKSGSLNEFHFERVYNFVLQTRRDAGGDAYDDARKAEEKKMPEFKTMPPKQALRHMALKTAPLKKKLLEFNDELKAGSADEAAVALDERDLVVLDQLCELVDATSQFHSSAFPDKFKNLFTKKFLKWPGERFFPIVDILKVLSIHGEASVHFASLCPGFINDLAERMARAESKRIPLLGLRLLYNMCSTSPGSNAVSGAYGTLIEVACRFVEHEAKDVRSGAVILLHNVAFLMSKAGEADTALAKSILEGITKFLVKEAADAKKSGEHAVSWAIITTGTVLLCNRGLLPEVESAAKTWEAGMKELYGASDAVKAAFGDFGAVRSL